MKLLRIKLNDLGQKASCIVNENGEQMELPIDALKAKMLSGLKIANADIVNDELIYVPNSRTFDSLLDRQFGEWTPLEYLGQQYWKCQCSCNKIKGVFGPTLIKGKTVSCGHDTNQFIDLTDRVFGHWKVLKYVGNRYWLCQCDCTNKTQKLIQNQSLLSGKSTSCGHDTTGFIDLTNQKFGHWTVLSYGGHQKWLCECDCKEKIRKLVSGDSLRSGKSTSCRRCGREARLDWQKLIATDETLARVFITNACLAVNDTLTYGEIEDLLNVSYTTARTIVSKFNLQHCIKTSNNVSNDEQWIADWLISLGFDIEQKNRSILDGKELDLYLPDYMLAIEYNGVYWHNANAKSSDYHKQKTLACLNKDVQLIHIFDYEWKDLDIREKLKSLILSYLHYNQTTVYAYDTILKTVTVDEERRFLDENHLHGYVTSNTALGLYYDNELIEIMTFKEPDYTSSTEIELLRLCTKHNYRVVDGAAKLFNHYIKQNNTDIITYCDISKFIGRDYFRLGFLLDKYTAPDYCYVSLIGLSTLPRQQCTKQKLIEQGYGTEEQSEEEIMRDKGYVKVYNCGYARYIYKSNTKKED